MTTNLVSFPLLLEDTGFNRHDLDDMGWMVIFWGDLLSQIIHFFASTAYSGTGDTNHFDGCWASAECLILNCCLHLLIIVVRIMVSWLLLRAWWIIFVPLFFLCLWRIWLFEKKEIVCFFRVIGGSRWKPQCRVFSCVIVPVCWYHYCSPTAIRTFNIRIFLSFYRKYNRRGDLYITSVVYGMDIVDVMDIAILLSYPYC